MTEGLDLPEPSPYDCLTELADRLDAGGPPDRIFAEFHALESEYGPLVPLEAHELRFIEAAHAWRRARLERLSRGLSVGAIVLTLVNYGSSSFRYETSTPLLALLTGLAMGVAFSAVWILPALRRNGRPEVAR